MMLDFIKNNGSSNNNMGIKEPAYSTYSNKK